MQKREAVIKYLTESKERHEKRLDKLQKKSKQFSIYRLIIFISFLTSFLTFFFVGISLAIWISVTLFVIVFGIVTGFHNKIDQGIKKNKLWIDIKASHLARINLNWENLPEINFTPKKNHPFAGDLNIVGENSIHQLLNTAVTNEGAAKLEDWLTTISPDYYAVMERQLLVKEMVRLNRFRDKLSLKSHLVSKKNLTGTHLLSWINSSSDIKKIKRILNTLWIIIPINLILLILWAFGIIPAYWLYTSLILFGINGFNIKYPTELFEKTSTIQEELGRFIVIFDYLERYQFRKNSLLEKYCTVYKKNPPSSFFRKVNHLADAASMQNNYITGLILNAVLPWSFFISFKLEMLKLQMAKYLPEWLDTWYELEAYNSLSNFAYLNPDYTFPEITNDAGIKFNATGIAHPLIHYSYSIPNDFLLKRKGDISLITGSNMSGKSTFLKSAGTNSILAYAGTVVKAVEMKINIYKIYTCINISDSVTDGISHFYAEVQRLKQMLKELTLENSLPVLYLIDEIFKGTNNRERLTGSRAFIKNIAGLNGAGLITTHDLELTALEKEIHTLKNYHFREEVSNGKMVFDFKLHEGPCPTTNALKIMEMEGLPIE